MINMVEYASWRLMRNNENGIRKPYVLWTLCQMVLQIFTLVFIYYS